MCWTVGVVGVGVGNVEAGGGGGVGLPAPIDGGALLLTKPFGIPVTTFCCRRSLFHRNCCR